MFFFSTAIIISVTEISKKVKIDIVIQIHDILLSTVMAIPWVVTVGFWILLSDMYTRRTTSLGKFDALNPHSFNLVMILIEIILSKSLTLKFGF